MQISDVLAQTGGFQSIARELGIEEQQAQTGADALLPAILGGFQKQARSGDAGGIGELLAQMGGGGLMDQVLAPEPTNAAAGDAVIGQIFGSRDVSRAVAQNAGRRGRTRWPSSTARNAVTAPAIQIAMSKMSG